MKSHFVIVFVFAAAAALAFQITPTPAPTKTPPPELTITPETESATDETDTDATGEIRTFSQSDLTVITGNVQRPNGMIWHDGKLYVVCNGDWTLYEIDDTTGATRTYIYGIRNGHSLYTEFDDNGDLSIWVPDFDTNALFQVNPVRAPNPVANSLDSPWGLAYLNESQFLITSLAGNSVLRVDRDGVVETLVESLRSPTGIAVDDTSVYVANSRSARRAIEWFDLAALDDEDTEITPEPLVSGLQSTTSLVMAPDGYLYFAYALGTRGVVGRVDPEQCKDQGGCRNDEIEIVLYTELAAPLAGLTISPDMRLFVHTMFRPEIYWVQLEA